MNLFRINTPSQIINIVYNQVHHQHSSLSLKSLKYPRLDACLSCNLLSYDSSERQPSS